jgi:hypothetical protein
MSNFIDKLSNKFSGHDDSENQDQYGRETQDQDTHGMKQSTQGRQSGTTRSGQQNLGSGAVRDQQFATGMQDETYGSQDYSPQDRSSMGQQNWQQGESNFDSSVTKDSSHAQSGMGMDMGSGNSRTDMGSGSLGSGRQTRSQAGQQGSFASQPEGISKKGFDRNDQEGQKYINRNL